MKNLKEKSNLFSLIIALFACFGMINILKSQIIYAKTLTNNIFIYPTIIGFYFICKRTIKYLSATNLKHPLIVSILFALSIVIGNSLDVHHTIFKFKNILNFFLIFPMTFLLINTLFANANKIYEKISSLKYSQKIENLFFKPTKKCFLNCFIFFLICYLPVFLAYFPGIFTYDVFYQMNFFVDPNHAENNPFLHNLLVYCALFINQIAHSKLLGVLCYTILQASIMFSIFSYCIQILSKYNINHYFKLLALLFFAIYPLNHVFVITSTKDTLFSGFVLLFVLQLIDLYQNQEMFLSNGKKAIGLLLTAFIMFALRHNGIYAYCLFLPALFLLEKKYIIKAFIVFITPIFLFSIYGSLKTCLGVKKPTYSSAIGIPLQQMGRVRKYIKNLDSKDIETYRSLVSKEKELAYFPYNVDAIKIDDDLMHSNHIEKAFKNPKPYIDLWIKWGLKYPKVYTDAFLINNYTFWYPNMNYMTFGLHYFFYTQNRWENIYGIEVEQRNYIPSIKKLYDALFLECQFENYPIISSIFSISFALWLNIVCFFILLYKRKFTVFAPLIFNFCLFATILLGPVALLRYIYFNYLLFPIFFSFAFDDDIKSNVE